MTFETRVRIGQFTFEAVFTSENVGPWLFYTHRFIGVLFPLHMKLHIWMCPLR